MRVGLDCRSNLSQRKWACSDTVEEWAGRSSLSPGGNIPSPGPIAAAPARRGVVTGSGPYHETGCPGLGLRPVVALGKDLVGIGRHREGPPGDLCLHLTGLPGLQVSTPRALGGPPRWYGPRSPRRRRGRPPAGWNKTFQALAPRRARRDVDVTVTGSARGNAGNGRCDGLLLYHQSTIENATS